MQEIDGAKTLLIGIPENGDLGSTDSLDGTYQKIEYLSINQYENDHGCFYLFLLNGQFETLHDYLEDSVDDSKKRARQLFPGVNIIWVDWEPPCEKL